MIVPLGELAGLHFVISTGVVEKPDPELRKLIRSHVMLGKNRGKKAPHRKGGPKRVPDVSSACSDALPTSTSGPDGEALVGPSTSHPTSTSRHPVLPVVVVPSKFGSASSTIQFADASIEPGAVDIVLQCGFFAPYAWMTTYLCKRLTLRPMPQNLSLFHCQEDLVFSGDMHILR